MFLKKHDDSLSLSQKPLVVSENQKPELFSLLSTAVIQLSKSSVGIFLVAFRKAVGSGQVNNRDH